MWIGNVEVTGVARLAPMAAVTNAPFRLIARECGSGLTTTEEIDAISLIRESPVALDIVRHFPEERPLAMQLLGSDGDLLVRAATIVQEAGADIVDLNMGCPMPKITKQGKGAALMRDVPATAMLIRSLRRVIDVPFTVKLRGGWDDTHLNAVEVARMCEDEGVDAVAVHPRTQSQRFGGKAPWEIIADVVKAVRIPVTGNGDVRSMAEARAMMAATGCANVMVGRGVMGRPWLFDEAFDALPSDEQRAYKGRVIERHLALIQDHFAANERYRMNQVRKHLGWYVEPGLPNSNLARAAVHSARSEEDAIGAFWNWWGSAAGLSGQSNKSA